MELEIDPADPLRYRTPDGWRRMDVFEEEIPVAGAPSETVEVRETVWGPVTGRWGRPLAIRWIAHDPEGHRTAYLGLGEASSIEDVFRSGWGSGDAAPEPGCRGSGGLNRLDDRRADPPAPGVRRKDSGVLGGRDAELGRLPGTRGDPGDPESRMPDSSGRRTTGWWTARSSTGSGGAAATTTASGRASSATGSARWKPPTRRRCWTSNWRTAPTSWRCGARCSSRPWRARASRWRWKPGGVLQEGWTGRASVDSAAYPLVRNARLQLFGRVYGALTAPAADRLTGFSPAVANQWPGPLLRLAREAPAHFVPPGAADWSDALRQAVLAAAERGRAAGSLAERTWGAENVVHIRHPLSPGLPPPLSRLLSPFLDASPRSLPGDEGLPRKQVGDHGPSNRFVVAPGREETGILHMPGGQSGHPGMPYYLSGHRDWEEGRGDSFPRRSHGVDPDAGS